VIDAICSTSEVDGAALNRALEAAVYNAKPATCKRLLELGADPYSREESTGETVLHQVITKTTDSTERTAIVGDLILAGAAADCRTITNVPILCFAWDIRTRGESPLHRAAAYGSVEMIQMLLDVGADRTSKDAHGETPLTWASWHLRDNDVLKLLLYGEFERSIP
jgi:uncharacterized protein